MRARLLAFLAVLPGSVAPAVPEPLLLRIRPNDPPSAQAGPADPIPDATEAARMRALREAVWVRADRRARVAVASVCTGCMKPMPHPVAPAPRHERTTTDLSASGRDEANRRESDNDPVRAEPIPPALLAEAGDP